MAGDNVSLDESSDSDLRIGVHRDDRETGPVFRDAVRKTMLPKNFGRLKKFLDSPDQSVLAGGPNRPKRKESSVALRAFREISYLKFDEVSSSDEVSHCTKESYVDSGDSDLIKEGYVFERRSQPLSRDSVNKKVKKWKKIASERLDEVNKTYMAGGRANKETFSVPLGLEANRKLSPGHPDDGSSLSRSKRSSKYSTEDELDIRRNDEFLREVRRVLKRKTNSQALTKRSLPEEYSRLIFKKSAFLSHQANQKENFLALTEKGEPEPRFTDTGADGDNTSGTVAGIFDQLSQMVLRNKISKNSKAAFKRNEVLRRVEEKRGLAGEAGESDNDEKAPKKIRNEEPLKGDEMTGQDDQPTDVREQSDHIMEFSLRRNTTKGRLTKVESYLSSISDVQSVPRGPPHIDCLSKEREQLLFDGLSGEFLKDLASGNKRSKVTQNDKKLLALVVKRYIERNELSRLEELLNSNLDEASFEVPPYENVTDREEYFLKTLIKMYVHWGKRDSLEDLIAWIYYKMKADKTKSANAAQRVLNEEEVLKLVNAFKRSGRNASLDRVVKKLVKEHERENPGLNGRQIKAVEDNVWSTLVDRFARTYLQWAEADVDSASEPHTLAVNVRNELGMSRGFELLDVNGKSVEIEWKFDHPALEADEDPEEGNSEPETDGGSSDIEKPTAEGIEPIKATELPYANVVAVRERLEDMVWNIQQQYLRQKQGKPNRTCSVVKRRTVTLTGEPNKGRKSISLARADSGQEIKRSFEVRREKMRGENIKWLLEQKEMLKGVRRKDAKNMENFDGLPKRLENMIATRNRKLRQCEQRASATRNDLSRMGRNK